MASFGSRQLTQYYNCILCFNAMVSRWVGGEGGAGAEGSDPDQHKLENVKQEKSRNLSSTS